MLSKARNHYNIFFDSSSTLVFFGLISLLIVSGLMEVIGIASILPFFSILMDQTAIEDDKKLMWLYSFFAARNNADFALKLGFGIIGFISLSTAMSLFTIRKMNMVLWRVHDRLSERVMNANINLPYEELLSKDPSTYSRNILNDIEVIVAHYFIPIGMILSRLLITVVIIALIAYTDWQMACVIAFVFTGLYALIFLMCTRRLKALGVIREDTIKSRFLYAAEIFYGVKEIKIQNPDLHIIKQYTNSTYRYSRMMEEASFLQTAPRSIIEAFGLSSAVIIVMVFILRDEPLNVFLPSLVLFAVGGFRLLPSLQMIYSSLIMAKVHHPLFLRISDILKTNRENEEIARSRNADDRYLMTESIEFRNLVYRYPRAESDTISNFSAKIPFGKTTALIGPSGSGKSTLVDMVLGLLPPTSGDVFIDGRSLPEDKLYAWRRNIGYVPQKAIMLNASIQVNIAFMDEDAIDRQRVEASAKLSMLHDFISTLPNGYDTKIGEDGYRLSGGQHQRMMIARALYRDPDILIMDEPTSALDGETQDAFIQSINQLRAYKTILLISHSAKVAQIADHCILVGNGILLAEGPPGYVRTASALGQRLLSV
jgi:ABC-type bacteriocin/lantibiotic exporter with double-glycine peptidase domain